MSTVPPVPVDVGPRRLRSGSSLAVLSIDLGADGEIVRRACAPLQLRYLDIEPPSLVDVAVVVVAAAARRDLGPRGARPHVIAVVPELAPGRMLASQRGGADLVVAAPLDEHRLTQLLGYLSTHVPPRPARSVALEADGRLASETASTVLTEEQSSLLRALAEPGRVVDRAALGPDHARVAASLSDALQRIGAPVRILKVPHVGYRMMGRVRIEGPAAPR